MSRKPPVSPQNRLLPFWDPRFGYGDFEGFFADFLRLHPVIEITRDGQVFQGRVTQASRYETSGDAQNGIDIRAEVQVTGPDGNSCSETWAFQCKHRKSWSPGKTTTAIDLANNKFEADFYFLLVTCKLTSGVIDEGASHPKWQVWGDEIISSHLRALPNRDEAARVVQTYFGGGWPEAILGISAEGPLQGVGGYFAQQMEAQRYHHHKAELVGRKAELQSMYMFLDDPVQRVLIFPGAGGSGKSRLLRAFAQSLTPSQRRKWCVRFYANIGTSLAQTDLDALDGDPVIIIDDAHRESVEPLLRLILRKARAKVILATRPQGIPVVRSAAAAAGLDARWIHELSTLRKLSAKETRQVVESLLGGSKKSWSPNVVAQARGCLLIAVVACEMICQGTLTKSHLASHQDFEQAVFTRLIDEGMARLGLITQRDRIDRMLEIIALAGPIPREGPWFDLLAGATDANAKPHDVRGWLDDLKRCGLLSEKREGYRITPDLLSDYLLYKATFDSALRDKGFVADFLANVREAHRDEALARCLPNLAEAEWRARCESDGSHQSVIEPHLEKWLDQFRAGSFHRRKEMLGCWSRFGVYLPEQTLRIAKLALELTTADKPNDDSIFGPLRETYDEVVDAIAPLLKELALHHLEHMHTCFDLLWSIGAEEPKRGMHNNQFHPLSAIIEVAKLEYRKPFAINEHALEWMEQHFGKVEIIAKLERPVWWFIDFLSPFLEHSVEDNQYDGGGVFSWCHVPVDATRVSDLRTRVLNLVSSLANRGQEGIALNAIKVLGDGMRMVNIPGLKDDEPLQRKWLPQREDALDRLANVAWSYSSGFIRWAIWTDLWWHICYEPANLLRRECWQVFRLLKDTFELRLVRATCSRGDSEVTPLITEDAPVKREERHWKVSEQQWTEMCLQVAEELVQRHSEASSLHDYLADFVQKGVSLDYSPGLGTVLTPLAQSSPALGDALAWEIIRSPRQETKHAFGSLIDGLCPLEKPVHLDLVRAAADSSHEVLQVEAARVLLWWQRKKRLPKEGEALLFQLVTKGSAGLLRSVLHQASHIPADNDAFINQLLESVLENPTSEEITEPLLAVLDRVEHKKAGTLPPDLVSSLLRRLVPIPRIHGAMQQHHLNHLAETHPREVFAFYRQRVEYSRSQKPFDLFDHTSYEALPGHGDHISLRYFAEIADFEVEFIKLRGELIAAIKRRAENETEPRIHDHGGYIWQFRQLARWLLKESGEKYAPLVSAWIPLIETVTDLWLFIDVVVGESPVLVLRNSHILESLLKHIAVRLPDQTEKAKENLMFSASRWVGASRNPEWRRFGDSTPREEEEPWHIIPRVEKKLAENTHIAVLGSFYEELLRKCRAMLDYHRRTDKEQSELDDDD